MVTLYDRLKEKEAQIKELTDIGVVAIEWLRNIHLMDDFKKSPHKKLGTTYDDLAFKYNLGCERVKRIVYLMQSPLM